jgi:hypothetical protein
MALLKTIMTHEYMTLGFVWSGFFMGALAFKKQKLPASFLVIQGFFGLLSIL